MPLTSTIQATARPTRPVTVFCIAFFTGVGCIVLATALSLVWNVIPTDIAQPNPNRAWAGLVYQIPVMSLLIGLWVSFGHCFAALLAMASICSLLAYARGKVPLWPLLAAIPAYALLIYGQDAALPSFSWYTDHPDAVSSVTALSTTVTLTAHFLLAPVGSWWVLNRSSNS